MDLCSSGISIPPLSENECGGTFYSTNCVYTPTALTYLGLPINSNQSTINAAIITQLTLKDAEIASLQSQVTALDHFKGRYESVLDLETAVPTALDGDYAYIGNELNPVTLYIWDSNPDFLGWTLV